MNNMMTGMGGGFPMATQDQGGTVNLFGNMTIIHTQQFGPRNPVDNMTRMMIAQQNAMNMRQAMMIEQQKLALEEQKLKLYDKMADLRLASPENQKPMQLANGNNQEPLSLMQSANIDDVSDAEVIDVNPTSENIIEEVNAEPEESVEQPVEYEIKHDTIFYDFSVNADYLNLSQFFNERTGMLLPNIIAEIETSKSDKIKIRCSGPGKPGIIFMKCNDISNINSFWRNEFKKVLTRFNNSPIKIPYIESTTDFIIFIMDKNYEKINIINLRPVELRVFDKINVKEQIENYKIAKEFVNWINDNNSLVENGRISSATVIVEPILSDIDHKYITLSTDSLVTNIKIESVLSDQFFNINPATYIDKYCIIFKN